MKTYKVIIRAVITATKTIEVKADSELDAIDIAENEARQWDVDDFNENIEMDAITTEYIYT